MKKKNAPASTKANQSAADLLIVFRSPRQRRVLAALSDSGGWIMREALDRIAGASNSPDVILRLRQRLGQDAIEMRQVDSTDRDGRACKPGQYRLTAVGRQRLAEMGGA